jgi:hypothetical protein
MKKLLLFFILIPCLCFGDAGVAGVIANVSSGASSATETLAITSDSAVTWSLTGTGDHYSNLSDDSDSTYVSTSSFNNVERYELANTSASSGKTISSVRVYLRINRNTEGTGCRAFVYPSGGTYDYQDIGTITTSFSNIYYEWTLNPADSAAWASSDIDGLLVGFRSNTDASGTLQTSECWVEVIYVP